MEHESNEHGELSLSRRRAIGLGASVVGGGALLRGAPLHAATPQIVPRPAVLNPPAPGLS